MSSNEQPRMKKAPGYAAKPPPLVFNPDAQSPRPRRPMIKQNVPPVGDITKTAKYKQAKNRWTGIIVGAATSIYFSYVVYQRLYMDKGQKKVFHPHQSPDAEIKPASTPNP